MCVCCACTAHVLQELLGTKASRTMCTRRSPLIATSMVQPSFQVRQRLVSSQGRRTTTWMILWGQYCILHAGSGATAPLVCGPVSLSLLLLNVTALTGAMPLAILNNSHFGTTPSLHARLLIYCTSSDCSAHAFHCSASQPLAPMEGVVARKHILIRTLQYSILDHRAALCWKITPLYVLLLCPVNCNMYTSINRKL